MQPPSEPRDRRASASTRANQAGRGPAPMTSFNRISEVCDFSEREAEMELAGVM